MCGAAAVMTLTSPAKRHRGVAQPATRDAVPAREPDKGISLQTFHGSTTAAGFRDAAVAHLSARLAHTRAAASSSLELRPSLQKAHDELAALVEGAVTLRQNASLLIIGEPGVGKTLVRE